MLEAILKSDTFETGILSDKNQNIQNLKDKFSLNFYFIVEGIFPKEEKRNIINGLSLLKANTKNLILQKLINKIIETIKHNKKLNLHDIIFEQKEKIKTETLESLYLAIVYILDNRKDGINCRDMPINKFIDQIYHIKELIICGDQIKLLTSSHLMVEFIKNNKQLFKHNTQAADLLLHRLKAIKNDGGNNFSVVDARFIMGNIILILNPKYLDLTHLVSLLGYMADFLYKDEIFIKKCLHILLHKSLLNPGEFSDFAPHLLWSIASFSYEYKDMPNIIDYCIKDIDKNLHLLDNERFGILFWSLAILRFDNYDFIEKLKNEFSARSLSRTINDKNISQLNLASHFYNIDLKKLGIDKEKLRKLDYCESNLDLNVKMVLKKSKIYKDDFHSQYFIEEILSKVDFYFPKINNDLEYPKGTILFMDGFGFHEIYNTTNDNYELKAGNKYANDVLAKKGYKVIRITSNEWSDNKGNHEEYLKDRIGVPH